jgi:hypothetical protein
VRKSAQNHSIGTKFKLDRYLITIHSHTKNQVNISNYNEKKVATKYLAKFQSPRAITRPKIIGPEQNVNLICNSSLYTHIPKIKSISQSIAKKKWQLNIWLSYHHFISLCFEILTWCLIFGITMMSYRSSFIGIGLLIHMQVL